MTDRKLSNASQSVMLPKPEGFDNIEYYLRITGTSQYDKRVMTFGKTESQKSEMIVLTSSLFQLTTFGVLR
jgi:hypothetical protein